ncbi:hypothetical protein LOCC1_G005304 [Lachnellula occidentalis]|uniref:Asteroid domain-containing protein n=1 Tax=Lachnellula occidentalis TaxID=215460 RepID=A0A8H8RZ48_9HELO|nr:hypothetical protein LOCC1_G005304 [Lachnellula occidentalis]
MGIPRLTQCLRPYAVSTSLAGFRVVIDGPGLAYHVWHICLSARRNARNAFETAISYAEIGAVVLAWLDALRRNHVLIERIYFDGYLPVSKRDVREERIVRQTQQLFQFRNSYPSPCRISSAGNEIGPQALFSRANVPNRLTQLPPLPFLVPAVLEALVASEHYSSITEVIPAEADVYCAQFVKDGGGVIITGDSDLLVHDLGQDGAVIFFGDLESNLDDQSGINGLIYRPTAIADRLGLPEPYGLHALAFQMKIGTPGSLANHLVRAKALEAIVAYPDKYRDFKKEYASLLVVPDEQDEKISASAILRTMDPRVSEYALQYPCIASLAGQTPENSPSGTSPHIFIPFLLDCPIRTNAWEASMAVRQIAYGMINLIVSDDQRQSTVFEHKRQEGKSKGRELTIPDMSQIAEACSDLVSLLSSQLPAELVGTEASPSTIWTAAAVYQDVQWAHYNSKPCLSQLVGSQFNTMDHKFDVSKDLSWDVFHLHAQIQGSHYSFRMLKQILALVISQKQSSALPKPLTELNGVLQTLPALSCIPGISQATAVFEGIEQNGMLVAAQKILGIFLPVSPSREPRGAIKTKRKRDQGTATLPAERKKPNNPFGLLDVE